MRLFAFVLSLFILVLSTVPCSDDHEQAQPSTGLSDNHSDHEQDSCTPFCSCSCCGIGGIVLSTPVFSVTLHTVQTSSPSSSHYSFDFISSYFYSFWQPPKLS
ncbi:MAG TPA: DUF6660 family protein [Cytophagaceae bacterium]|nr:DUF6660 family protein [Cytophagaceae bacterium]